MWLQTLAYQKLWDYMSWLLSYANQHRSRLKHAASEAGHATCSCILTAAPDFCTCTLYFPIRRSYIEPIIWPGEVPVITTTLPVHKNEHGQSRPQADVLTSQTS